jgi:hypothetical protein
MNRLLTFALLLSGCGARLAEAPDAGVPVAQATRYLLFQSFYGADAPPDDSAAPVPRDQAVFNSDLSRYVSDVRASLQPDTVTLAAGHRYGFAVGPLTLEQTDDDLAASIKTAFDVAIEQKIPVAFHLEITHSWRFARRPDGTLLSDGDNREWKDWSGTIADPDPWDDPTGFLMPSMCFECDDVKALVDHHAASVIAPAIKEGLERLKAAGDEDLLAAVFVGWEAGSLNSLGYHSLSRKGYGPATSMTDLNKAQQHVLNDYLKRWTQALVDGGVPRAKIYTHTSNASQWDIDANFANAKQALGDAGYTQWLLEKVGNGPDSFWDAFTDDSNAGFSIYVNSAQEGMFDAIWAEAAKHSGSWAEAEGTNVTLEGKPSELDWETYLAKVFNHGGTVADLFGGFLDGRAGGYETSTESAEAVAAYRKFLRGDVLQESAP